jgi:hypothetical protein
MIGQFIDMPESLDPKDPLSKRSYHVAVFRKIDNEWWLLDAAEDEPLNFTKD